MAAITWTGAAGDGNYNNPMNWSPMQVPTSADAVTISTTAATAISLANDAVQSLTTNKFVTLNLADNSNFTIGTGAATTFSNAGTFAINSTNNYTNFIIGASKLTLSGGGTIKLSDSPYARLYGASAADILNNTNNLIEGGGQLGAGQLAFTNGAAGVVDANVTNALILNISSTVINSGLLESTGGGGLLIESNVNDGTTGQIKGAGGTVSLQNATIQGGTLSTTGTGAIAVQYGQQAYLDGSTNAVTNLGALDVTDNGQLHVLGSIVNKATLALQSTSNYTRLILDSSTVTLSGAGTIALSDSPYNQIYGTSGTDVLNNTNNTITGAGQLGAGQMGLINGASGIINASAANNALVLNTTSPVLNSGLIEATGAAGLVIQGTTVDDSTGGTILAASSTVNLNNSTIIGGVLKSTGTGINTLTYGEGATLDGSVQAVTSIGTLAIQDNASLTVLGTLVNQGVLSLGSTSNYTRFIVGDGGATNGTTTLTGGGVVTLSNSPYNLIYGVTGSDTLVNLNNTISGAGSIGLGQLTLVNDATINANAATDLVLNTGNTVSNNGLLEATGTGGLLITSGTNVSNATGTVLAANSAVYLENATITGGLVKSTGSGAFNVTYGQFATFDGSASAVTDVGTVDINDNGSLTVLGSIVNQGTIALQSTSNYTRLIVGANTTLTGGGKVTLSDGPNNLIYGASSAYVLENVNNTIIGAGALGSGQLTLLNDVGGTIEQTGSNALTVNTTAFTNNGLLEATGAGGVLLQTTITNGTGGTIAAAGGNVNLQNATIQGGTLTSSGGGVFNLAYGQTATLDGSAHAITSNAVIDINDNGSLTVLGSIINKSTIALQATGNYTRLILGGNTTLSGGGTVTLSDSTLNYIYGASGSYVLTNSGNTISGAGQFGNGQLTLVNSGTIAAVGANVLHLNLGSTGTNTATGAFLGQGAGGLSIENGTYTNSGLIEAQDGSSVTFQSDAVLTNSVNGTLTGGTYGAVAKGHGATLSVNGSPITTDAANILLQGAGSVVTFGGTAIEASLTTIAKGGVLQVLGSRGYTSTLKIANSGTINLAGGTFKTKGLNDKTGSLLSGYGSIVGNLTSAGTIAATGGTLDLKGTTNTISGAESGTGTLSFDKGTTTFNTGASLGVSNIAVINAASLAIATNLSFSGVFDIVGASAISGAGTLSSSGTFEQTGTGAATIGDPLANSGTISTAAGGTLAFTGGLANTGLILDNGGFTDTAALTGGSLTIGAAGATAVIASGAGAGNSTVNTLTVGGGTLNTSGTTLTVTGDYNNTAAGVGNAYMPFAGVTGTIDGQGTQLAVVGVNGTTITSINGTLTIAIAKHGTASFVIENTGAVGSAALRGALETTVNGGHITGTNLSGSGVTAQDFGPIAAGGMSSVFTIAYTAGSTAGDAIHFASDFANVAGLTIAITQAAAAAVAPAAVSRPVAELSAHDLIVPQHGWSAL